jgi:hypothetical protein
MSHASKARKKAMKRAKDREDPERAQVRNMIKQGKVPRWTKTTTGQGWRWQHGIIPEGMPHAGKKGKWKVPAPVKGIVSSFGLIFEAKTIQAKRNAASK